MVVLRADPWRPDFGAEVEAALEEPRDGSVVVDPAVETADWSRPVQPAPPAPGPVTFVDGVRRVDIRVLAEEAGRRAWGLLGSYAVGSVRCDGAASIGDIRVGRAAVLGGGIRGEPVTAQAGRLELRWEPHSAAGEAPQVLVGVLHHLMRRDEATLASELAPDGMVVADGPLHFPFGPDAEVVGMAKRMLEMYLEDEHAALLPRLSPGERTPLFALGRRGGIDRYAWYQRLVPLDGPWHELSGIVRCEVLASRGLERAVAAADRLSGLLPRFAGRPGVDPRAPQNLTPVGALETRLRHRLGHAAFVRRALQVELAREAA